MGTIVRNQRVREGSPVHPHGRGDNNSITNTVLPLTGSPPRAWGQLLDNFAQICVRRFTPTGVGTINRRRVDRKNAPVHPHGRGDNAGVVGGGDAAPGSPPRAWGQSNSHTHHARFKRFTPTGVGTMRWRAPSLGIPTVHPHGRGDNMLLLKTLLKTIGSPPRAWGQWSGLCASTYLHRFTPTGVGTICSCRLTRLYAPVHPHGRGDCIFKRHFRM